MNRANRIAKPSPAGRAFILRARGIFPRKQAKGPRHGLEIPLSDSARRASCRRKDHRTGLPCRELHSRPLWRQLGRVEIAIVQLETPMLADAGPIGGILAVAFFRIRRELRIGAQRARKCFHAIRDMGSFDLIGHYVLVHPLVDRFERIKIGWARAAAAMGHPRHGEEAHRLQRLGERGGVI